VQTLRATVDPASSRVEAETESGQRLVFEGGSPQGGDPGPSPTQGLLAALAACTAIDVASILRKKRQRAEHYEVVVVADRSEQHPRVFTRIVVEHRVRGAVEAEALRRAIELSATRYCPVNAMLSGSVVIEHRYHLRPAEGRQLRSRVAIIGPGDRPS
jgi:putative redox protein